MQSTPRYSTGKQSTIKPKSSFRLFEENHLLLHCKLVVFHKTVGCSHSKLDKCPQLEWDDVGVRVQLVPRCRRQEWVLVE